MNDDSVLETLRQGRALNIAHRGARSLAPENTLAAAAAAFDSGAGLWELDVCATRDGELLVVHDDTLDRTSNVARVFPRRRPWRVCDFSLEEIRQLDFGSWFIRTDPFGQIKANAVSEAECNRFMGLRAPTLLEALVFTQDAGRAVNIEIKDQRSTPHHDSIARRVVSVVESLGMADRVIISSFHHGYLEQVRALSPSMICGVLTSRRLRNVTEKLLGLAPATYHPKVTAIDPEQIGLLRDDGHHVLVWVANDRSTMVRLLESGASGLFTDFPQVLNDVLIAYPAH
ncbi:MAG: glycerophosphodiester phosphodiesterase [Syntrophobacteraceae bacterium]